MRVRRALEWQRAAWSPVLDPRSPHPDEDDHPLKETVTCTNVGVKCPAGHGGCCRRLSGDGKGRGSRGSRPSTPREDPGHGSQRDTGPALGGSVGLLAQAGRCPSPSHGAGIAQLQAVSLVCRTGPCSGREGTVSLQPLHGGSPPWGGARATWTHTLAHAGAFTVTRVTFFHFVPFPSSRDAVSGVEPG